MASSKREKELARQRAERQAARRAAAAARRRQRTLVVAAVAASAVVLGGVVALGFNLRGNNTDTLTPAVVASGPSNAPSAAPSLRPGRQGPTTWVQPGQARCRVRAMRRASSASTDIAAT